MTMNEYPRKRGYAPPNKRTEDQAAAKSVKQCGVCGWWRPVWAATCDNPGCPTRRRP